MKHLCMVGSTSNQQDLSERRMMGERHFKGLSSPQYHHQAGTSCVLSSPADLIKKIVLLLAKSPSPPSTWTMSNVQWTSSLVWGAPWRRWWLPARSWQSESKSGGRWALLSARGCNSPSHTDPDGQNIKSLLCEHVVFGLFTCTPRGSWLTAKRSGFVMIL